MNKETDRDITHRYVGKWINERNKMPTEEQRFLVVKDALYKKQVSELNEILNEVGVTFALEEPEDADSNLQPLIVKIDLDIFAKIKNRGAGRGQSREYQKKIDELNLTVGDVKEMKKSMKHDEIIAKIGISRAAYYRAWKLAKEKPEYEPFLQKKV